MRQDRYQIPLVLEEVVLNWTLTNMTCIAKMVQKRALWIGDEKISTRVRAMMYNHIHYPQEVKKWQE
jgi:hypothetical protein